MTLLAAAARSQLAFRLLAQMADLRRLAASTDELTGLPNRRALYAEGQARLVEPQRRRLALLMLDLDKFKEGKSMTVWAITPGTSCWSK